MHQHIWPNGNDDSRRTRAGCKPEIFDHLLHDVARGHSFFGECVLRFGFFEKRKRQEIFDNSTQAHGVAIDNVEETALLRRISDADIEQRFDIAPDVGDRCTKFVRDICSKLATHRFESTHARDIDQADDKSKRLTLGVERFA